MTSPLDMLCKAQSAKFRKAKFMAGISKPRMLVILSAAIAQAETRGLARLYIQAVRDVQDILLGNDPLAATAFWRSLIAESDKRSRGGFAAMSPERLREVSAHGRGSFNCKLNATEAGKKGGLARAANTTPGQRREWSARGAEVTNSKRRR